MTDHTARDALARELCQDRNCCVEGCYAGLRTADRLLASPALDAVVAERVAALAEDEDVQRGDVAEAIWLHRSLGPDHDDYTAVCGCGQKFVTAVGRQRHAAHEVLRALAAALRERGQSNA